MIRSLCLSQIPFLFMMNHARCLSECCQNKSVRIKNKHTQNVGCFCRNMILSLTCSLTYLRILITSITTIILVITSPQYRLTLAIVTFKLFINAHKIVYKTQNPSLFIAVMVTNRSMYSQFIQWSSSSD